MIKLCLLILKCKKNQTKNNLLLVRRVQQTNIEFLNRAKIDIKLYQEREAKKHTKKYFVYTDKHA